jgi:tetratricopeptide (TPR) repeat protein
MSDRDREALQLCQDGLQLMWRGEVEDAICIYDRALAVVESDEERELITIRKAEALIAAEREGAEVAALPGIVMRRRSPRHVYLAAGTLMRRFVESEDRRRAIFYGEIARDAASSLNEPLAHASILNHLGITLVADSQFVPAIDALEDGLEALSVLDTGREDVSALEASLLVNLGGAKVLRGESAEGVGILESVFSRLDDDYTVAEACLDLCFGYLQLERYDIAENYGRRALGLASVKRQVRNANHLLGEVCVRTQRYDESDAFFEVVASFYPDFKNVKQLLVSVDLSSVVNWKA